MKGREFITLHSETGRQATLPSLPSAGKPLQMEIFCSPQAKPRSRCGRPALHTPCPAALSQQGLVTIPVESQQHCCCAYCKKSNTKAASNPDKPQETLVPCTNLSKKPLWPFSPQAKRDTKPPPQSKEISEM